MTPPNKQPMEPTPAAIIPLPMAYPALNEKLPGNFRVVTVSVIPEHNPRILLVVTPTPASLPVGKRYTAQ